MTKPILARETAVVMPCVMQEQCIGDFCAETQRTVFQNEIRNLGETATRDWIARYELDVALDDDADRRHHSFAPCWLASLIHMEIVALGQEQSGCYGDKALPFPTGTVGRKTTGAAQARARVSLPAMRARS